MKTHCYMRLARLVFRKKSLSFCSLCAKVKDNVSYFIETTMEEDVSCVTDKVNCPLEQYEKERIEHLSKALSKARDTRETDEKWCRPRRNRQGH